MFDLLRQVLMVAAELAPWLMLGAAAGGLLHVLVPPGLIRQQLRGPWGVAKAVAVGVPLPLCSCGVIPAGLALFRAGASRGASIGFLTATPQTGVDSVLVSGSLLGWPFAAVKVAAALATGLVAGWTTDWVDPRPPVVEEEEAAVSGATRRTWRDGLEHAVELVRSLWGWLAFGILVSAALNAFLPAGALAGLGAYGALPAMGLALLVGLPLYVCATASVPIAAALVAGGLPTGAALVFLMAGPATNAATVGSVYRAFGGRALLVYLSTLIAGSVGFGLVYEALFGSLGAAAAGGHHHDHGPAGWELAFGGLFLLGLVGFAAEDGLAWIRRRRAERLAAAPLEIPVEGMTCTSCAARLERVLGAEAGVAGARVDFQRKVAVIKGQVNLPQLEEAIRAAGFEPAARQASPS